VEVSQDHFRMMYVNPKIDYVTSRTQTTGLYGRATWKLGTETSLLTGLRYNRDKVAYTIDDHANHFSSANTDSASTTVGDLTLRRKFGRDHMVYGTYARGYKPRAFNTAATLSSNAALKPVDQEDIDHFEFGAKSSLMGGALALNLAAFNTTYKNFQVQLYPPGQIIPSLELANAAKARTRGIELDGTLAAGSATRLNFSAAYIDARFLNFKAGPAYPGQTPAQGAVLAGFDNSGAPVFAQDLSGKPMPDAPKFKMTLGIDHELAPDGWPLRLNLNAQYAYRTSALLQGNQNPNARQPGFGILNLGVTASPESGKYQITAFVNNALNKFYLVNAEDFFSGLYAIPGNPPTAGNAVIGQPARDARRYVGLRFSYFFE
jgi:iron complex outermembrane receptor protein